MKILTLDVSLNSTGFCFYDNKSKNKINFGVIENEKIENENLKFFYKSRNVLFNVREILKKYTPDVIVIEGVLFFLKGNVFVEIVSINYMVRQLILEEYNKLQTLIITPPTVFKKLFLKGNAKKKELTEKVLKQFDLKIDKEKYKKEDDICDAIMFLYCFLTKKEELLAKSIVINKIEKKENEILIKEDELILENDFNTY